ncbi:MAG TPA: hypothetical protein VK139_03360, partial [Microbacteriaceae bacterium]|nr:hypothetical protein [Microbacteriaceae bacterium]
LGPYGFSTQLRVDDWYVGCAMVVMMALMMWDRPLIAFATFAMFTAVQLFWSASSGIPFGTAGPIMLRHAGTLLMTFAIARGFRQLARQLSVTAERRARREREDAVRNAIATERSLQAARIEATAGPILRRLQSGNPLTAEERRECLLIEATVRDAISGRGWATASVLDAARAARERGVTVVLLDEARDGTRDVETARTALVATLDTLTQGRCVARLVPTGRDVLASILVDDLLGNTRVLEVQRRY